MTASDDPEAHPRKTQKCSCRGHRLMGNLRRIDMRLHSIQPTVHKQPSESHDPLQPDDQAAIRNIADKAAHLKPR
jgi:hypothetical protein